MKLQMRLIAGMLATAMIVSSMGFSTGSIQAEAAVRETGDMVVQDNQTDIISDETEDALDTETTTVPESEDNIKNNELQADEGNEEGAKPQTNEQDTEETETESEILKGEVNDYGHITWQIDENGNLTIEGEGNLLDKANENYETPWYPYRDKITSAKITVKNMTNAYRLFRGCENMVSVDVSDFDTGQITNMGYMFEDCKSLTALDVSRFDTGKVTYMYSMFSGCINLEELDVSGFDTGQVTHMGCMFAGCKKLKKLDVSHFNTGKASAMFSMFSDCNALEELDVSSFDTSQVTIMDHMFGDCEKLTALDVSHFDTSRATNLNAMFSGCKSLTAIDVSHFDTSHVIFMSHMFSYCPDLAEVDVSAFDTGRVTAMYSMFAECSSLTSLDLSSFNTSRVTDMHYMFSGCTSLTALDLSCFDTSRVTTMYHMFENCKSLAKLDISSFNTSQVTDMSTMFSGCSSLTELNLNHFNTDQVTDMRQMFSSCTNLKKLDISSFNTSLVTNMYYMFSECSSLTELDLKHFNTSQAVGMGWMFSGCSSLTKLDVSGFDTSHVKQTDDMFRGCSGLTELDLSSFDLSQADRPGLVLYGCTSLTRICSPVKVIGIISLPKADEDTWYQEYSDEPVTNLPRNLAYSVLLEKNKKPAVTYPCLKARKTKIHYECGETLHVDDLTVVYYEEEQAAPVDSYTTNAGEIDMSAPGLKELVITYNGQSTSINIIVSPKQEYKPPKDIYIVEFDLQGHGTMDSIKVTAGEKINKPEDPTAADYTFTGWFKEIKCKNKWDFDTDTVNSDITLYAGWEQAAPPIVTYNVSFDLNGHGTMDMISVTAGSTIVQPADPAAEGYLFTGWYKDAICKDKWDFNTDTVNSDITLYAGWEQAAPPVITYSVSFDLNGHGTMDMISVTAGSTIVQPATPTDPGYLFKGWYTEAEYKTLWNFTTDTVTGDMTLYARWEEDESYDGVLSKDIPQQGVPEDLWATQPEDFTYTGKAITPDIRVYYCNKRLDAGIDYTLSYKNNTNAGKITDTKAPSVIIKGKSVYAGKKTVKFNILPADLNSHEVVSEDIDIVYNGKKQSKIPALTYNGKKLTNKKDFTVSYEPDKDYREPGDYQIFLEARDNSNFAGQKTIHMQIRKGIAINKTKIKLDKSKIHTTYTGNQLEPPVTVTAGKETLQKDVHYTVRYENNTEIGTASAIVTGIGDYAGTKKITFKIAGTSLKKATVTGMQDEEYTGLPHRPKITVTLDKVLEEGRDYKVSYLNNKNAGKASIMITGINAYTGTVKKTFKITAYSLDDTQGFLEGLDGEFTAMYNKKGSKPELNLTFKGKPLVLGRDYTITCKNNKSTGKNPPTATIKGKGNFKGKRTIPFTITKDPEQISELLYQTIEKGCKNQVGIWQKSPC